MWNGKYYRVALPLKGRSWDWPHVQHLLIELAFLKIPAPGLQGGRLVILWPFWTQGSLLCIQGALNLTHSGDPLLVSLRMLTRKRISYLVAGKEADRGMHSFSK